MEVFKVFATMSLQDLFTNPLHKIQAEMKSTEKTASGLTNKFASIGKVMAPLAITAGILLGTFGHGVAIAADFEQSMAATSTMFGNVAVDTQNLSNKILELSSNTGIAATELNSALYNALSSGIPVTEDMGASMDFMTKSVRLAKAGFTDIDTAVSTTAKILNAYKMNVAETDTVHKILVQTQNLGITTVGELGQSLAQVTPTAAAMNVGFEQIGAALASMTAQGTATAQATTQLNGIFAELGKSGTQAQQMLIKSVAGTQYAGQSFQDLMKSGIPLSQILDLMGNYAKKNGKNLLDMFSSIDAGKAALALSGANAAAFTNNLAAMGTEANIVSQAYNKVADTLQESLKRFSASKDALLISIGSLFTPILKVAANIMSTLTQGITSLIKTQLGEFLLKAVASISALIVGISVLLGMFFLLKIAIVPIGVVIGAISTPILSVMAILILLYMGFKTNFGGIADVVGNLWNKISLTVRGISAVFKSLNNGVGTIRGTLAEDIQANGLVSVITTVSNVLYRLWQFILGFTGVIKGALADSFKVIQPLISSFGKAFSLIGSVISLLLPKFISIDDIAGTNANSWALLGKIIATVVVLPFRVLGQTIEFTGTVLEAIIDSISGVITFFKDLANGVNLFDAGSKLISTFASGILSVINKPKEILAEGLSSLRNLLPFSDAKEGPLSTLTLSGERMMTTMAGGINNAAPLLQNATVSAFEGISPVMDITTPNIPNIDMNLKPVTPNIINPKNDRETTKHFNKQSDEKDSSLIQIHIDNVNLPSVKDGGSFIEELRDLALSLGVK